MSGAFPVDAAQVEEWIDVVSSDLQKRQGRPFGQERKMRQESLHATYDSYASQGLLPANKPSCTNMSIPKGFLAQQLAVNYRTNVHCHFDKYVRRFVKASLTTIAKADAGLAEEQTLSKAASQLLKTDIRAVCNDILQSSSTLTCREAFHEWVVQHMTELMPPAPKQATPQWRFLSQKQHPERWLPYMVWINQKLEAMGSKLYSPLPQRTAFVPSHVRIDTNGLLDLLIADTGDAALLKAGLEDMDMPVMPSSSGPSSTTKYNLPGLITNPANGIPSVSKKCFYDSLSKILHPSLLPRLQQDPTFHTASFKTAIWRCLTKLGSNKHAGLEHMDLVFNNVIDTDGHSVSLHYVSRSLYGKTIYNGGFKEIKGSQRQQQAEEKARGATYVTTLSEDERARILQGHEGAILSCDPGKDNLATVTDGRGEVVTYTYVQRRAESGAKEHNRQRERMITARPHGSGTRSASELMSSIGQPSSQAGVRTSAKSCATQPFHHYLRTRRSVASELSTFFQRRVFRAQRFDVWVGRRASEDRFISRIKNTFGNKATLLYGDWGRSPNLRHQPPSPGVGLRRRLCSHFKVYLVHEAYTSSFCPRCTKNGLCKPRRDIGGEVHHLLKCANPTCSCPWWNRDILGALNILRTGLHALETGMWHPVFARSMTTSAA